MGANRLMEGARFNPRKTYSITRHRDQLLDNEAVQISGRKSYSEGIPYGLSAEYYEELSRRG